MHEQNNWIENLCSKDFLNRISNISKFISILKIFLIHIFIPSIDWKFWMQHFSNCTYIECKVIIFILLTIREFCCLIKVSWKCIYTHAWGINIEWIWSYFFFCVLFNVSNMENMHINKSNYPKIVTIHSKWLSCVKKICGKICFTINTKFCVPRLFWRKESDHFRFKNSNPFRCGHLQPKRSQRNYYCRG